MINMKFAKIWGKTQELFNKNNVSVHRLEIKRDTFCSLHKHEHKHNIFFVEQGQLKIIIYRKDAGSDIVDETILNSGDMTSVENGLLHRFEAIEDSVILEIYYVELDKNDIVRENVGGIK